MLDAALRVFPRTLARRVSDEHIVVVEDEGELSLVRCAAARHDRHRPCRTVPSVPYKARCSSGCSTTPQRCSEKTSDSLRFTCK